MHQSVRFKLLSAKFYDVLTPFCYPIIIMDLPISAIAEFSILLMDICVHQVALNLAFLSIFSGLAALLIADIARNL